MFHHIFEFILLCLNNIKSIREGVALFIWMYFPLPWFYAEHQRRCCTMYLNVFSSTMIIFRSPKKVLDYLFECISVVILCKSSKKVLRHFYLNAFSSSVFICRESKKVLHHLLWWIILFYDYKQSIIKVITPFIWMYYPLLCFYAEHQRRWCNLYFITLSSAVLICRS